MRLNGLETATPAPGEQGHSERKTPAKAMASSTFSFSGAVAAGPPIWRGSSALSMLESTLEQIQRPQRRRQSLQSRSRQRSHQPEETQWGQASRTPWFARLNDLTKTYGKRPSLQGLSLNLAQGSIYGLLGPNGAGKSTTLQILATLLAPDSGTIMIGDVDARKHPRRARALMGYVGQECALDKVLTGREHLWFQADLHHLSDQHMQERASVLIEQLNMSDWIDRRCGSYSGGMRRRLDLACGLMHQPSLLILDEPTVGLDIESRTAIWRILEQLRDQGTSILLSSHYIEEVEALTDRIGIIEQGRMLAEGNAEELKKSLGGDRISIRIEEFTPRDQANEAADLIGKCRGVRSLVIDSEQGNALHLVVDDTNAITLIKEELERTGLPLFSLSHARASLNDLYVQATGRSLCDADRSGSAQRDLKAERRQSMR